MFRILQYKIEKNFNLKRGFNDKKDITKDDVDLYIKQGTIIIDVRSPQEYREGHIDGAICIPDYQIKKEISKYVKNKEENIILYCSTGHRSQKAQKILENIGYTNVYNVYEGILF
ncbi:rhodanese domain protein [Clostridium sp. CAG:575]|nr:rhodanese domain protein [Clostridium sp. CAG:575]